MWLGSRPCNGSSHSICYLHAWPPQIILYSFLTCWLQGRITLGWPPAKYPQYSSIWRRKIMLGKRMGGLPVWAASPTQVQPLCVNDSVERERLKMIWRGENSGIEILGYRSQSTSGSVSFEQVKGHVFWFWQLGRRAKRVWIQVHLEVWQEIKVIFFWWLQLSLWCIREKSPMGTS